MKTVDISDACNMAATIASHASAVERNACYRRIMLECGYALVPGRGFGVIDAPLPFPGSDDSWPVPSQFIDIRTEAASVVDYLWNNEAAAQ